MLKRAKIKRQKRRRSRMITKKKSNPKKLWLGLIVLALFGFFYLINFSQFFAIEKIEIANEEITSPFLENRIQDQMEVLVGENLAKIEKEPLINNLKTRFKEINNITLKKKYPKTLVISYSEHPLVANVIYEDQDLRTSYVINSLGYSVKQNSEIPSLPYIRVKNDESVNVDRPIISADKLRYILEAQIYFTDKFGMRLIETEYKPIAREVHLLTEKDFYLWLDIQRPSEEQFKKLKKALVQLDIYNEPLQYIDLRIAGRNGDKIIYK